MDDDGHQCGEAGELDDRAEAADQPRREHRAQARHEWATAVGAAADHDTTHLDATLTLLTAIKDGLVRMRPPTPSAHPRA